MRYPTSESLVRSFKLTYRIIKMQADGLTTADSLLQLPFRGNCLNWVLGHIVEGRNRVLTVLDEQPIWDEANTSRYERGAEPITSQEQALPLEQLLSDLDLTQDRITDALELTAPERLAEIVSADKKETTIGETIAFWHWHETYHTGQLELLRQFAGKNDAIIS